MRMIISGSTGDSSSSRKSIKPPTSGKYPSFSGCFGEFLGILGSFWGILGNSWDAFGNFKCESAIKKTMAPVAAAAHSPTSMHFAAELTFADLIYLSSSNLNPARLHTNLSANSFCSDGSFL